MSEGTGIVIEVSLLTVCMWFLMLGLNIPVRRWHIRRYEQQHDMLERVVVERKLPPLSKGSMVKLLNRLYLLALGIGVIQYVYITQSDDPSAGELGAAVLFGLAVGAVVVGALWFFYRRTKTVNTLELRFDRRGLTIFPARQRLSGQGIYEARIEWKDCCGYWVYKGYVIFGLRPIGQIEQFGGEEIARIEQILHALGVRKLVSYDVLTAKKLNDSQLSQLDNRVQRMAGEVIAGYATECAMLNAHVEAEVEWRTEDDRYSVLILRIVAEDTELQSIEWLLWGEDENSQEALGLSDDRLYEGVDERVQSLLDFRRNQLGQEAQPVLWQ
ncbi:hypothetical protein [Tumebacillus flagellatus]|uniref:Uncharacterized protein n=1 Tax=Tumebacillus flagellatus TaxID=1157490 RepID=A0A074LNY6_9BACL|nr:hypothetical protein [Tumebacillus flagellatus]KEO82819.1 hypothetical protein EL26_12990 [Tumebacillus flagellatus]